MGKASNLKITIISEITAITMVIKTAAILLISVVLISCATGDKIKTNTEAMQITRPKVASDIRNIALLLPLSGDWAATSKAIRNGFLAAYYSSNSKAANKSNINVKVVDTSKKNIIDVYRETVASGVDVIVGPLTKQEVETLTIMASTAPSPAATAADKPSSANASVIEKSLPVPTIALNTLSDYQLHPVVNLYQFGLLPQDEARQAAIKILQDGYRNVAVIAPATAWGHGVAMAFQNELIRHGGFVVVALNYTPQDDFDLKIQQLLRVDTNELRSTKKVNYHRNDINAVFLVADNNFGKQLAPLLKFYTNNNVPLYATSHIYNGFVDANLDQDLSEVSFCDIPWTITNPADLDPSQLVIRNKINTLWPDSLKSNIRLYALGVDAYSLAINFNKLIIAPQTGLAGATGQLTLDNQNHIYRQLKWTTFKHGIPQGL